MCVYRSSFGGVAWGAKRLPGAHFWPSQTLNANYATVNQYVHIMIKPTCGGNCRLATCLERNNLYKLFCPSAILLGDLGQMGKGANSASVNLIVGNRLSEWASMQVK